MLRQSPINASRLKNIKSIEKKIIDTILLDFVQYLIDTNCEAHIIMLHMYQCKCAWLAQGYKMCATHAACTTQLHGGI